ncbi:hypothetical protein BDN72DRAFT_956097 [Pluteus cervinus]|uniref:Uncharacterized protein n=1 Tax=Pluteus cervinus TaxID=181527 RepID=A0ACD3B8X9_9AGAR|nr:hypothetical protein BDN72DRAFT_956097 [Pluteus cervinus]
MVLDPIGYYANAVLLITYGIYLVLSLACLHFQLQKWRNSSAGTLLLAFNIVMLLVNTTFMITMLVWMQYALAGDVTSVRSLGTVKDSMNVLNIWMANGLLLYRLYIIFSPQRPGLVIAGPLILMIAVFVTGILLLVEDGKAGTIGSQNQYGVAFWCLSLMLNLLVTCLITTRLLPFLQHSQAHPMVAVQARRYMSIISGLIESASLYSITGLLFVTLVVAGSPLQIVFGVLFNAVAAIAPNLILLRIALGTAFTPGEIDAMTISSPFRYSFHKESGECLALNPVVV